MKSVSLPARRRDTALATKQYNAVAPAFARAFGEPAVQDAFNITVDAFADDTTARLDAALDHLVAALADHAPDAARFFGGRLKVEMGRLALICAFVRSGRSPGEATTMADQIFGPARSERLMPDNPITLMPDGRAIFPAGELPEEHFHQWRDYSRSLRPEGKRGPKPVGGTDTETETAHQMKRDGKSLRQIADAIGVPYDMSDAKSMHRMRSRVRTRIQRGAINAQKMAR